MRFFVFLSTIVVGMSAALAIPAKPTPITYTQPDDTEITITMQGDERHHIVLSDDGYLLVGKGDGYYYANVDERGNTIVSDFLAREARLRTAEENAYLQKVDMKRVLECKQMERNLSDKSRTVGVGVQTDSKFPSIGETRALVILAEYQDRKFVLGNKAYDYFNNMLNQEGFSDYKSTGSARDYFVDASCGKFKPQFDVYGPVTLPQKMSYYGENLMDGVDRNAYKMIIDACKLLDEEIDFSQYDLDNDGFIDNVYLFYAGLGEAQGGGATCVWPHSYNITLWEENNKYMFDGVQLDHYATSNEWLGNAMNGKPDGIGTFVHEFTHVMGIPDLYAITNYTSFTPGHWSVLDAGPYHNDSRTPPTYGVFERNALGWIEPVVIDRPMSVEMPAISKNGALVIETDDPEEFFLLENRQQEGWDTYIPHHGMLVWHIQYDSYIWMMNKVNDTPSHQYVDIEEADGLADKNTVEGDAFPGTANITSFTDDTRPAMKTWAGKKLNFPITDIEEVDGVIKFNVLGGGEKVVVGETNSISSVDADKANVWTSAGMICSDAPGVVYTLDGRMVGPVPQSVAPGAYIVRTANGSATKLIVK